MNHSQGKVLDMKINKFSCQTTQTNIFKKGPWKQLRGAFHWTKIPVSPMEMNIGCTDPTQVTSRLLIVLLRRLPKSGCKEKQLTFSNGKGRFGPTDQNDWTGLSGPPSKVVKIFLSEGTKMVVCTWFPTENCRNLRLNGKRLMQETVAIEVPPQNPYYWAGQVTGTCTNVFVCYKTKKASRNLT